mmetsp:Transcript_29223/g.92140  ORF Transcript_29223/g.92140 Transcript_29223/m.92140 type:complete len:227 (-) Transcript_29223:46-726(-)
MLRARISRHARQQRAVPVAPPVLLLGDDRLRRVAERCRFRTDGAAEEAMARLKTAEAELHARLKAFRAEHGFGRAIAAPQIDRCIRMIACNLVDCRSAGAAACPAPSQPFTLCNPELTWRSEETFTMWDDCMSFPGLLVRVARHRSVSLRWQDSDGQEYHWERLGQEEAELLQHEMDHLDGVLAVDLAVAGEEDIVRREEFEKNRGEYLERVDWVPGVGAAFPEAL